MALSLSGATDCNPPLHNPVQMVEVGEGAVPAQLQSKGSGEGSVVAGLRVYILYTDLRPQNVRLTLNDSGEVADVFIVDYDDVVLLDSLSRTNQEAWLLLQRNAHFVNV